MTIGAVGSSNVTNIPLDDVSTETKVKHETTDAVVATGPVDRSSDDGKKTAPDAGSVTAPGSLPAPPKGANGATAARATEDTPKLRRTLAQALCRTSGTATAEDVDRVVDELVKLPAGVLRAMQAAGRKVVVCRGSVTEHLEELRGVQPRGWPPGMTWDTVPGLYDPASNSVVIATCEVDGVRAVPATGNGHGSANLVIHEAMHGFDSIDTPSDSEAFTTARDADLVRLSAYELQDGAAGREETFAESGAEYYGAGDITRPHLVDYYREHVGEP